MAAGGALEPFWDVFASHKSDRVAAQLEALRIGNISPQDRNKVAAKPSGAYANEPSRPPIFKVHNPTPFNAETPAPLLADTYITPNELFFIRNHLPVPVVDASTYALEIRGVGLAQPVTLTLHDLQTKFPQRDVTATMQCAGNRRAGMDSAAKRVNGIPWGCGAIGNATWTGVRLRDVLLHAGLALDQDGQPAAAAQHVCLVGLDAAMDGEAYEASIPMRKALDPLGDVILAWQMNGAELPRDHGYPLRVVIPGYIAGRSIKWLSRIEVTSEESKGFFQQKDYKAFSPSVDPKKVDFSSAPAMQEFPIQSAVTSHADGAVISADDGLLLKGFAWSGGGRKIIRVDVSIDGGVSWQNAHLNEEAMQQLSGRAWAWTPWSLSVDIPEHHGGKLQVSTER